MLISRLRSVLNDPDQSWMQNAESVECVQKDIATLRERLHLLQSKGDLFQNIGLGESIENLTHQLEKLTRAVSPAVLSTRS